MAAVYLSMHVSKDSSFGLRKKVLCNKYFATKLTPPQKIIVKHKCNYNNFDNIVDKLQLVDNNLCGNNSPHDRQTDRETRQQSALRSVKQGHFMGINQYKHTQSVQKGTMSSMPVKHTNETGPGQ
uniref:Uncharacterized protein n=1 Tax=Glossina austeni TaxID=7395 RepID=A0A1A9VQW6_GLOAU